MTPLVKQIYASNLPDDVSRNDTPSLLDEKPGRWGDALAHFTELELSEETGDVCHR